QPNDWIIRGVKGELYPCKPDIFEATYEAVMTTRPLNLIDDHRRLHLQQSEVEPTLVCVLLFCEERPVAYAHADVQRCRFSMPSDGPFFWVGDTSFLITEQERREIERFLWDCRPLLNAETMFSGRMNQAER